MKTKLFSLCIFLALVTGCQSSAPDSVKKADAEAQKLTVSFINNNNKLFKVVADMYRDQGYKHIEHLAEDAVKDGSSSEDIARAVEAARAKVDANYIKILEKFIEIQVDLKQSAALREQISKYMESEINYKELADILLGFAEQLSGKKDKK